jgi:hypothetical protein
MNNKLWILLLLNFQLVQIASVLAQDFEKAPGIDGAVIYDHNPGSKVGDAVFGDCIADFSDPVNGLQRCSHGGPVCLEYADGTLAAFYANTSSHNIDGWSEYALSRDGGKSWDGYHPFRVSKEAWEQDPKHPLWIEEGLVTGDGTAVLILTGFEDGKRAQNRIMRSSDHGRTWGPMEPLDREVIGYPAAVALDERTSYVLFDSNDGPHVLYASTDQGQTWERRSTLPLENRLWYGALCGREDGRLLAGAYTEEDEEGFYFCISEDGGRSWGEQQRAFVDKMIRDPELAFLDGKYYLHGRSGQDGEGSRRFVLYQSNDGMTWKPGVIISSDEGHPDGYSHNTVINRYDPDRSNELMILYSIVYSPPRTNEYVFYVKPVR